MIKLIYILATLFVLLLATGCSHDTPLEPNSLSVIGNYYKSNENWAAKPSALSIVGEDVIYCSKDEKVNLKFNINGDDFVSRQAYLRDNNNKKWVEQLVVRSPENTEEGSNNVWLIGDAYIESEIDCSGLSENDNEFYLIAYSCLKKTNGGFDCHGGKWQLEVVNILLKNNRDFPDAPGLVSDTEHTYTTSSATTSSATTSSATTSNTITSNTTTSNATTSSATTSNTITSNTTTSNATTSNATTSNATTSNATTTNTTTTNTTTTISLNRATTKSTTAVNSNYYLSDEDREKYKSNSCKLQLQNNRTNHNEFISEWDVSISDVTPGLNAHSRNLATPVNSLKLPLEKKGIYDFIVYWGDGTEDKIESWDSPKKIHKYSTGGIKTVKITGVIDGFNFKHSGDKNKLIKITQWGPLKLGNNGGYFTYCDNLISTSYNDTPDLRETDRLTHMFAYCKKFNQDLSHWDTSCVKQMFGTFLFAESFNGDISTWDTSTVTSMRYMFKNAKSFNSDISDWDVSNVGWMDYMFTNAESFKSDISDWDVSKVVNMKYMFSKIPGDNLDLSKWNTSSLGNMVGLFYMTPLFNSDISGWDVSKVITMFYTFHKADKFNQDLSSWDTSNVKDMFHTFREAKSFNQDLSSWNTSSITRCAGFSFASTRWTLPKPHFKFDYCARME